MARGFGIQQKNLFGSVDRPVICPKPRRPAAGDHLGWTLARLADPSDDLLHILLPKMVGQPLEQSSPIQPFFCGSPPARSANPIVLDTRFSEAIQLQSVQPSTMPGSSNPQIGLDRIQHNLTPTTIRIEGFNCLNSNCSCTRGIPVVA
ncbi:hypothetical protein KFK09_008311 [Dendrobium nobile]|uniref:Uncharacterized protein n=1 Tax=Dendrobium nobile TaxID=94219 RepID=A0A8T3BMR7_DENNO|nr:hypothetical protein KFK09_008311 [Dendrobium nobile]